MYAKYSIDLVLMCPDFYEKKNPSLCRAQNRYRKTITNNLHHCRSVTFNLRCILDGSKTDIAILQQPWVYKNRVQGLNSKLGTTFVETRTEKPRACIYVTKDIHASLLQEYSNRDQVTVLIKYMRGLRICRLICCSVYLPYGTTSKGRTRKTGPIVGGKLHSSCNRL
jgi:hypothetical protein